MRVTDKKETYSHWMKEADKWFSLYVRLKEADEDGVCKCFICGIFGWYRTFDLAHYNDRDNMMTRYNEMNCHSCCQDCNRFDDKHRERYALAMVLKYSFTEVEQLERSKHSLMKYTRQELKEIAAKYKNLYQELKREKKL